MFGGVSSTMSGGAVIVGFSVSFPQPNGLTTTRCVQVAVRPTPSVTVQVMIVVPTGYGAVSSSLSLLTPVIETPVDGSVVGVPGVALAKSSPCAAVTVTSAGQEIVGAPAVTTVTSKLQPPPPSL